MKGFEVEVCARRAELSGDFNVSCTQGRIDHWHQGPGKA